MTGPAAQQAYASALQRVQVAEYNVHIASTSTAKILSTLEQRFSGAAAAKAGTFAGKIDALRARMHNLGIEIGGDVEKAVIKLEQALLTVINVFDRFKAVALILEGVLVTGLAVSVGTFLVGKIQLLIAWMGKTGPAFGSASAQSVAATKELQAAVTSASAEVTAATDLMQANIAKLGPTAEVSTTEVEAALARLDVALQASAADAMATGVSMSLAMGPVGIAVMGVVAAVTALALIWESVTNNANAAKAATANAVNNAMNGAVLRNDNVPAMQKALTAATAERSKLAPHERTAGGRYGRSSGFASATQERQYKDLGQYIQTLTDKIGTIQQNQSGLGHGPGSTYKVTPQQQKLNAQDFNKSNLKAAEPVVHIPWAQNPLAKQGESMLKTMQSALESSSIRSMRNATDSGSRANFEALIHTLKSAHEKALNKLIMQLTTTWKQEVSTLTQLLVARQMVGIADQTATIAQAMSDQTQIMTDRFNATANIIQDQSNIETAKLNERGLYGLNLVAQRMTVGLDQMTVGYDRQINAGQLALDQVTKQQDILVGNAKKRMDLLQGQSGAAYTMAESVYKEAQSHASLVEAQASRTLAEAQGNAKIGEAKQQELIAIEQAKANTEFAGSGVHIQITGINPTDAAAVANAVSWNMRTKIPA